MLRNCAINATFSSNLRIFRLHFFWAVLYLETIFHIWEYTPYLEKNTRREKTMSWRNKTALCCKYSLEILLLKIVICDPQWPSSFLFNILIFPSREKVSWGEHWGLMGTKLMFPIMPVVFVSVFLHIPTQNRTIHRYVSLWLYCKMLQITVICI